jgi:hypothetical protein
MKMIIVVDSGNRKPARLPLQEMLLDTVEQGGVDGRTQEARIKAERSRKFAVKRTADLASRVPS